MKLFRKNKKTSGWMAINVIAEGVTSAQIVREPSAKPCVRSIAFFATKDAVDETVLAKFGKDLNAAESRCTTMLGANEYQLLSVDAPNVPPEELKTAIRWKLKDMIDFPIDDATVDVLDVPVDKNAAMRNHTMYAVVARNGLIQQRQNLFSEAKIPLSVIDIPEMAQRNIASLVEPEGRGVAFLSFDTHGGLLTVTFRGELYLSRRIEVPLAQLQQQDESQRAASHDRITLELQRSLDHFDRQFHFITVAKMYIGPIGEGGEALRAYLATNIYVPVEPLDLETVLDISRVSELREPDVQRRYFMALGTALRHEEEAP